MDSLPLAPIRQYSRLLEQAQQIPTEDQLGLILQQTLRQLPQRRAFSQPAVHFPHLQQVALVDFRLPALAQLNSPAEQAVLLQVLPVAVVAARLVQAA